VWDKDTYNFMEFVRGKCEMILEAEKIWSEMPEGSLVVRKPRKKEQYYWQTQINGKSKQKYLNTEKDSQIIDILKKKKTYSDHFKEAMYWKKMLPNFSKAVTHIVQNFRPYQFDSYVYYSEKNSYMDELQEKTIHGEFVRSRAEALVADKLFFLGLSYRYEKRLYIGDKIFYPDFTVISPLNGEEVYIEYLGLNTKEYLNSWNKKLTLYHQSGIFENERLLVITEIQRKDIDSILKKAFSLERYSFMLKFLKITV